MIEVSKYGSNLRFFRDEEDLGKAGMIINEGHNPSFPRRGSKLGWPLNITMDRGERLVRLYDCEGKETRYFFISNTHITR